MDTAETLRKELGLSSLEELSKRLGFDVTKKDFRTQSSLLRILDEHDGYVPKHPRHGWMTG